MSWWKCQQLRKRLILLGRVPGMAVARQRLAMRLNKTVSNILKITFAYAARSLLLGVLVVGFSTAGCDDEGGAEDPDASTMLDGGTDAIQLDANPGDATTGDAAADDAASGDAAAGDAASGDAAADAS